MLPKTELERLRLRKELIVLQCDVHRALLTTDFRRVSSADFWMDKAGETVRRHPMWVAALAAGAGLVTVRSFRKPSGLIGLFGRVVKSAPIALSVFKAFRGDK